jgi:capsular polysaccharide biosynthesis protein
VSRNNVDNGVLEPIKSRGGEEEATSPFVVTLDSGYILSETGLVLTDDWGIVEFSAAEPEQAMQAMMAMCSRELFFGNLPVRSILTGRASVDSSVLDTAAPMIPRYPTNYYHWMVETVPKLRYLRVFERKTGAEVTVLVPPESPPFVEETLDLLDWPESKIAYATDQMYRVDNLIVPSFPERTSSDFDWLQREMLDAVTTGAEASTDGNYERHNVYVSRANAVERRVLNEDDVMAVLSEYGFERYCLEDRSLVENVRLFNQADVVVGAHGAGLTDIIFAEDCTLLELFGEKVKDPYERLAVTVGVDYEPMYCQAESADIVVDAENLEDRVSKLTKSI